MVVQRIIFTWFVLSLWEKMCFEYCCAFFTLLTFVSLFICFSVLILQFGVSLFSLCLCFCLSFFINFYVLCTFSFVSISISFFFLSFILLSICFFCFCLNLFFVGSICLTGRSRAKDKPGQPRATHCVAVKWLLAKIRKLFLRMKVRILLLIIFYSILLKKCTTFIEINVT